MIPITGLTRIWTVRVVICIDDPIMHGDSGIHPMTECGLRCAAVLRDPVSLAVSRMLGKGADTVCYMLLFVRVASS